MRVGPLNRDLGMYGVRVLNSERQHKCSISQISWCVADGFGCSDRDLWNLGGCIRTRSHVRHARTRRRAETNGVVDRYFGTISAARVTTSPISIR
jgi:hypothetical protein